MDSQSGFACHSSSVAMMTALTSGRLMSSAKSVVKKSAPNSSAIALPFFSSMSHNPSHSVPGYSLAQRARMRPTRPQPTTARPIGFLSPPETAIILSRKVNKTYKKNAAASPGAVWIPLHTSFGGWAHLFARLCAE